MKKAFFIFLMFVSVSCYPQRNEVTSILSTTPYTKENNGDVFQIKYERYVFKSLSIQTGVRYHNEIQYNIPSEYSKNIKSSFNSYKLDVTFLITPLMGEHYKVKAGLGLDFGISEYGRANRGIEGLLYTSEDIMYGYYWQYAIEKLPDYGIHFILQGNYYFRNNVFITAQILYNEMFDPEIKSAKYSSSILRKSSMNFGAGVGFQF